MECEAGRLGFVTGMVAEARCLRAAGPGDALIVCSGANPARAAAGTAHLLAQTVTALVSFGLAGGLDPALRAGDLVLAEAVVLPEGGRIETDRAWRERLAGPRVAAVAGSDRAVASVAGKRALFAATGAVAVDMESHAVARAALAAGVPFIVLRAIADPAERSIPDIALAGLGPEGEMRPGRVALGLLRRPWHLPALLHLAADSRAGMAALREAARLLAG